MYAPGGATGPSKPCTSTSSISGFVAPGYLESHMNLFMPASARTTGSPCFTLPVFVVPESSPSGFFDENDLISLSSASRNVSVASSGFVA